MEWEGLEMKKAPPPLRYNDMFLNHFKKILESAEIKKIGYAFTNDVKAIRRLYNGEFDEQKFAGFVGLEKLLFTLPSNMGLSTLVKRHYNLPLNKDLQTTIAENAYLSYEEATYAILDALLPLAIYQYHFDVYQPIDHRLKPL